MWILVANGRVDDVDDADVEESALGTGRSVAFCHLHKHTLAFIL